MKLVVVLACVALADQARDRPLPPTGTASVSGVVYLGASGTAPARRARVTVQSTTGLATGRTTITDNDGRFDIRELAPDRFTVHVTLEGWLPSSLGATRPGQPGRPIAVAAGERVSGLTLRMARGSAISGTVRDSRGRPVPNVWMSAARISYSSRGEFRLIPTTAVTDDRGHYRVWGLRSGTYVVSAVPQSDLARGFRQQSAAEAEGIVAAAARGGETPSGSVTSKGTVNFSPVFYPATSELSGAMRIELALEEERDGIDLSLRLVPLATVSGTLDYGAAFKPARQTVELQTRDDHELWRMPLREVPVDDKGQFLFTSVAPGTYRVVARSPESSSSDNAKSQLSYAVADVRVDGADVQLALQLRPAITVRGRSVFEGTTPVPASHSGLSIVLVTPGTSNLSAGRMGSMREDGTFAIDGVIPGTYSVEFLGGASYNGWFWRRAMLNGRDAFSGPIEILADAGNELVLSYTDRPSAIRGTLTAPSTHQASDYFIVLLPADRTQWQPGSRRIRHLRAAQDGTYEATFLPPGDYLIAALADLDPEDLFKATFLETLASSAHKISLAEGQTLVQNLKIG